MSLSDRPSVRRRNAGICLGRLAVEGDPERVARLVDCHQRFGRVSNDGPSPVRPDRSKAEPEGGKTHALG